MGEMLKTSGLRGVVDILSPKTGKNSDPSNLIFLFAAVVCAVAPLDISQLSFAVIGALLYMFLQKYDKASVMKRAGPPQMVSQRLLANSQNQQPKLKGAQPRAPTPALKVVGANNMQAAMDSKQQKQPSVAPIVAPNFNSQDWEGEVAELVGQLLPTPESEATVKRITQAVGKTLRRAIPEIEVSACAGANLFCGRAFGVAVPEVEIVASVKPSVLFARLHGSKALQPSSFDEYKLQKSAIRTCTDRLVADGLKLRRSKFRGSEPKVTLLVPADLGFAHDSVAVDFSVNVVTPLYNAALLTECGQLDARSKELILLVKRWAKDRGICHAAKGYFSPYVWGLLCVYFLQVGAEDGRFLPALGQFAMSSGLLHGQKGAKEDAQSKWKGSCSTNSTASLFKEFLHFYHASFDWMGECVSIRMGCRGPPASELPLHVLVSNGASESQTGPSIEDPFTSSPQNLGDCLSADTFKHLREEFSRADALCTENASLSTLLEPWTPPETEVVAPQVTGNINALASCTEQKLTQTQELPPWRRDAAMSKAARKDK